ncbi:MAG: rhomboid family intramembrane serine protease [Bacteroidetes bacterium]|nr:MAG: rhomboid family intramembrane serine protease [Bacteroidota bacterium]
MLRRNLNDTPVVKNLLILNGLFFAAKLIAGSMFHIDLDMKLGLFYWTFEAFRPYQVVTHMFMHADFWHIFMNMFTLYMFGTVLEQVWGGKRLAIFYFITGLGAALLHNTSRYFDIQSVMSTMSPEVYQAYLSEGVDYAFRFANPMEQARIIQLYGPAVGASGAVFGLLTAFGMLFPNTELYLYGAIPLKAKYFVLGLIGIELYLGFANRSGDNVAHFAHLGGVLFAYILMKYWKQDRSRFY